MTKRTYLVEVEADDADGLSRRLRISKALHHRGLRMLSIQLGTVQDIVDQTHALRDRLEA